MVAEQVGQLVRLVPRLRHDLGPAVPQQAQVIPEVLDALSPLVNVLGCGVAANVAKSVAAPAIAPLDPRPDQLPPGLREGPRFGGLPRRGDRIARLAGGGPKLRARLRLSGGQRVALG